MSGGPVLLAVLAFLAVERGLELVIHRRNARLLRARGAVWAGRDGFGLILLAQFALFGGLAVEGAFAPWTGVRAWTWPPLAAALLLQALRYWVILTLRERWAVRVVTVPGAPRITSGPYRFLRHPNYLVVALEALVLPLAFSAWGTLAVALPLQLVALRVRLKVEEKALSAGE